MKSASEIRRENALKLLKTIENENKAEFARRIKRSSTQVNDIIGDNWTKGIGNKIARLIEEAFKKPHGWLDQDHSAKINHINEPEKIYNISKDMKKLLEIPIYNAHYAMGDGATNFDHNVIVSNLRVTRKFIRENISVQTAPENLAIVTGLGDSMQPTFNDQDQLFMDAGVKIADVDSIYAFDYLGDFYIKRIQRIPDNGLLAISDNGNYKPFEIAKTKEFFIHGQIVGIWNFKRV